MKDIGDKKNGEIVYNDESEFDIFNTVIQHMEMAELLHTDGITRQNYVLTSVKIFIINTYGIECYRKYRTFIPMIIEFVISISKNGIYLLLNNIWGT